MQTVHVQNCCHMFTMVQDPPPPTYTHKVKPNWKGPATSLYSLDLVPFDFYLFGPLKKFWWEMFCGSRTERHF